MEYVLAGLFANRLLGDGLASLSRERERTLLEGDGEVMKLTKLSALDCSFS